MVSAKKILQKEKTYNNVNNVSYNYNNNVNNVSKQKHRKVEDIATQLVEKLQSPNSYKLFCLIAYKNNEQLIWRLLGNVLESKTANSKPACFVGLIKKYGEL